MSVDRQRWLEQGYLIRRNVIPPDQLDAVRASYETLLERQKTVWARERKPDDPPGGVWEADPQPRMYLFQWGGHYTPDLVDTTTANAFEVWLSENTLGASSELLAVPEVPIFMFSMMCSPVRDRGPSHWHRDVSTEMGPLKVLQDDVSENGPRYLQWNIPLYDDDVFWVVPASHRRLNTGQENQELSNNPRSALSNGKQVELKAGDGLVYDNYMLHWGSNYSAKLRRTLHGAYCRFGHYSDLSFTKHLSPAAQETFERWDRTSEDMQNRTEATMRAAIRRDAGAYLRGLDSLHSGVGEKGRLGLTVYLCKAAKKIHLLTRPNADELPADVRYHAESAHSLSLNWGGQFARRFSYEEAEQLWKRFKVLDSKLQGDEEQSAPGFGSKRSRYYFNEIPAGFGFEEFVASWG